MTNCIQIQWICGSIEEAKKIAHILIKKQLVACVNILPNIDSIYHWQGAIKTDQEIEVLLKTRKELFDKVRKVIEVEASYEVPAILALPIMYGNRKYLDWIKESVV